jgi:hypothetical protein
LTHFNGNRPAASNCKNSSVGPVTATGNRRSEQLHRGDSGRRLPDGALPLLPASPQTPSGEFVSKLDLEQAFSPFGCGDSILGLRPADVERAFGAF